MNDPATRLYDTADPSNHQDSALNGMRGEGAADVDGPGYHRTVLPEDQPAIEVEEISGVAFAEASRMVASPHAAATPVASVGGWAPADHPLPDTPRAPSPWPWIAASLALGFMIGRRQGASARAANERALAAERANRHALDQVLI